MGKSALLKDIESEYIKKETFDYAVGDTISLSVVIVESVSNKGSGNAKIAKTSKGPEKAKQRIQVFTGTVIAMQGSGASETVTLHRVAYGLGMERLFLINSPQVVKVEVVRKGRVRRAKLNYLKGKTGKQAKVQEKITTKKKKPVVAAVSPKNTAKEESTETKDSGNS
ncbi:50S ribosomal protein L19 [Chlamydiales bacterium SCGC AB-751-O23]|jgi:large subunit ribosomal protein L19|nr:50S ribosomal protein L19 [Chlamydiales bacterium SCGC AB-751-O23]